MKYEVVQAGVRAGVDLGNSSDGLWIEDAIAKHAKFSAAFAHKYISAGQKRYAERAVERSRQYGDLDLVLLGGIENERAITQRSAGEIDHVGLAEECGGKCGSADDSTSHRSNIRVLFVVRTINQLRSTDTVSRFQTERFANTGGLSARAWSAWQVGFR